MKLDFVLFLLIFNKYSTKNENISIFYFLYFQHFFQRLFNLFKYIF